MDFGDRIFTANPPALILDDGGIPDVKYGTIYFHNPVTVSQFGLHYYSVRDWPGARREARYLVRAQQRPGGAWLYRFDFTLPASHVSVQNPWVSAMAQGQAMSLLTRVFHHTDNRKYLAAALRALRAFRPVARGGVVDHPSIIGGRPFYEEYPTNPPILVLNGFLTTLLGLYDLAPYSHRARVLFNQGYKSLLYALPLYDRNGMGLYDLSNKTNNVPGSNLAPKLYALYQINLLRALDSVRPNQELSYYHDRWAQTLPEAPGEQLPGTQLLP
jgi:hypothetical protein